MSRFSVVIAFGVAGLIQGLILGLDRGKDEFVAGLARPVSFVQCRIPSHAAEGCCVKLCLPSTCLLVQADSFVHFAIRISSIRALRLALAAKAQRRALPG